MIIIMMRLIRDIRSTDSDNSNDSNDTITLFLNEKAITIALLLLISLLSIFTSYQNDRKPCMIEYIN